MLNAMKVLIVTTVFILTGCATRFEHNTKSESPLTVSKAAVKDVVMVIQGSDVASQSRDWEQFREEWRSAMKDATEESGITFAYQDATAVLPQKNGTLVVVQVNDYRHISQGARFMAGAMTGNAFVDADVSFFELPTKTPAGKRTYKTSSSAGQGIFAPMTAKQVRSISDEIVREISQK